MDFAEAGSPNEAGLPEWPVYDPNSDMLMNFGDSPKAQTAPAREALDYVAEWTASQRKSRIPAVTET